MYLKEGLGNMGFGEVAIFNYTNTDLIKIIKSYVDYNKQFDAFFLVPLNIMLDASNIILNKKRNSIFDL